MKIKKKQGLRNIIVRDTKSKKILENVNLFLPNIQSVTGFLKGAWDLEPYAGSFPGRNRLGDVDGSVEIAGHHLMVEFKETSRAMNVGQLVKAIRLAKYCNTTTVFVFGRTDNPVEKIVIDRDNLEGKLERTSVIDLNAEFRRWSKMATQNPMASDIDMDEDHATAYRILEEIKNVEN